MKRIPLGLAAAGVLLALLAGCSAPVTAGSEAGDTPVQGGTLVFSDVQPSPNVQNQKAGTYTIANTLNPILDRLTYFDPEAGELVPWIASEFSSNDTATEFTFKIREGVTFSDGTPLDAAAVKQNLDVLGLGLADAQIPKYKDFIGFENSEVVGDDTVVVHFAEPNSNFLYATASVNAGLVAPATLALDNAGQSSLETVIGSGPFVFESQIPDQEIVLVKRDDYAWPQANSTNQGAAYLDEVVIKVIPEVGLRSGALLSGQVDVARGIQPVDELSLGAAGYTLHPVRTPDLTANFAALRVTAPGTSDRDVRFALQIGFDRQELAETVLSDSYLPAASVLNHGARGFTDLSDEIAYDPEEANRLLDKAGWKRGADGIRVKGGEQLVVTVASSNQSVVMKPAFEFIEQQWRELGVVLDNRTGDNTFMAAAIPDQTVESFATRQFYYGGLGPLFSGAQNTNTFADIDELNALFAEERETTDAVAIADVIADEQRRIVIDDALALVLWDEVQVHGSASDVHITFTSGTAPTFHEAWIDREDR